MKIEIDIPENPAAILGGIATARGQSLAELLREHLPGIISCELDEEVERGWHDADVFEGSDESAEAQTNDARPPVDGKVSLAVMLPCSMGVDEYERVKRAASKLKIEVPALVAALVGDLFLDSVL